MLGNPNRLRRQLLFICFTGLLLLAGCALAPPDYTTQTKDPWEKMNRITFSFNQKFDKAIARPVSKTYVRAMPRQARNGIHNFLNNLGSPVTIINDLLQGQFKYTLKDTGRFLINSTVGLLGWFDVAQHMGLPDHDADFGETLAHVGVASGPYLVIPFLGPSSVRDAGAQYPDYYANPIKNNMQVRYRNAITLVNGIDTRAGLLDLDSTIDSAYDPYSFMRDAWIQHRRFQLYNGNPPMQYPDYPELPPDDSDDNSTPGAVSRAAPAAASTTPAPAVSSRQPPVTTPPARTNKSSG
ncbi:MAG TPA: VacJ family lipoprotein [Gammaproteobacteria bacterium]|nr:VacJ family lipoprotein [Gammaproteobacteria bacterium]